jgi:putative FmdB family regulatory protein
MPAYNYQCNFCGLRFEKRVSMAERAAQPCSCGQTAQQMVPDDLGFTFNQPTSGIVPQNTGLSSVDVSYDRIIAQDAAQKWEMVGKRDSVKRDVLRRNPGATKADLSRMPDDTYKVLKPEERRASEVARAIDAVATLQIRKVEGPPRGP